MLTLNAFLVQMLHQAYAGCEFTASPKARQRCFRRCTCGRILPHPSMVWVNQEPTTWLNSFRTAQHALNSLSLCCPLMPFVTPADVKHGHQAVSDGQRWLQCRDCHVCSHSTRSSGKLKTANCQTIKEACLDNCIRAKLCIRHHPKLVLAIQILTVMRLRVSQPRGSSQPIGGQSLHGPHVCET